MPRTAHLHQFVAGADLAATVLVLLHGSDGTETDLLPLAAALAPGATKLAVRVGSCTICHRRSALTCGVTRS